jgi:hypothetical protein
VTAPRTARLAAGTLALSLAVLTTSVAAQQAEPQVRPETSFVLAGSLHEGRGDDMSGGDAVDAGGADDSRYYTGGQFGLAFSRRGRRLSVVADANGGARYFRDLSHIESVGHRASAGVELRLGRSRLQAGHAYFDTPFQQLLPQIGVEGESTRSASDPDSSLSSTHTVQQASTVGWRRGLGRRSELAFNYGFSTTKVGDAAVQDVHQGGSSFRHRIGRGIELKLGHQARLFEDSLRGTGARVVAHDLDLGVDLERELSFSRRSRVAFTSGSSIVSSDLGRRFVATGQASLKHEINRTWNAVAAFARKVDFVEGLPDAVIGQTGSLRLGGSWGQRLGLMLRGSAGSGVIGVEGDSTYRSITTQARASLTLSPAWNWYVEHFYYQHTINGAFLRTGVPADAFRSGVRTGLDVRLDAIRRRR